MAVASLVLGIISLVFSGNFLGLICGILGFVFGLSCKGTNQHYKMAKAGLMCSIIGVSIFSLLFLFAIIIGTGIL